MRAQDDLVDYLDLNASPFLIKKLPLANIAIGAFVLSYSPDWNTLVMILGFTLINVALVNVTRKVNRKHVNTMEMIKFNSSLAYLTVVQVLFPLTPFWMLNILYLFRVAFLYRNRTQRVVLTASLALLPTYALLFTGQEIAYSIRPLLIISAIGFLVNATFEFLKLNVIEKVDRLREIEGRYSKLYNNSSEMRFSVDARTGKIIDCNQKLVNTLGYSSRDEIIGKKGTFIHHSDSADDGKALLRAFQTLGYVENWEMILAKKDGTKIYALISMAPIRDSRGQLIQSSSHITDITQQKKAEAKLSELNDRLKLDVADQVKGIQQQKEFLTKLVDSLPLAMFAKDYGDGSGRYLLWNKTAESYWGVSESHVVGKSGHEFMVKDVADKFAEADLQAMADKKVLFSESDVIKTTNGKKVISSWRVPVNDTEGKPRFVLGLFQDITEKIELENQLEMQKAVALNASKMATLGEMAGGIAHEINNPLAIIKGNIYRLKKVIAAEGELDKFNAEKAIANANKTIERITVIVDGLRNFSRDDSNDPFVKTSICEIIEDAIGFCRERFKSEGIGLNWNAEEYVHLSAECRKIQISQVLINLINNSRSAISNLESKKWVEVSIDELDSYIAINITDAGDGIPENIRAKLFRPFFTTKEVGLGTGLGLSISKGIVEIHGGRLFLDENCINTRFVILLPKTQAVVKAA